MYRVDQQLRSIYYTVSQATVLNATAIFWNKDLGLKSQNGDTRKKGNGKFYFFLVFFKVNRIFFYDQSGTEKKKI